MAKKQVRLSTEELHQVKQLMGSLLALLSFWALASLDVGSFFVLLLGFVAVVAALFFPHRISRIPAVTWRWAGPAILFLIVGDFLLHLPEFMGPLVRMVILLIIYRLLAPRNRREDLQVILLCLFCLILSGVLTVSLLFAFQILIFTPLAMALLFIICLLDRGEDTPIRVSGWERFSWRRLGRRIWQVVDLRVVSLCGLLFGLVVALSSLLFILTPRFDFNQAIPFLEITTSARSGFSENVSLGAVSEIQEDNSIALQIDLPSLDLIESTPYWRMLVLDQYGEGSFRLSDSLRGRPRRVFEQLNELRLPTLPLASRKGVLWTFYLEGGISRYLPMPGDFSVLRFQKRQDFERVPEVHVFGLDSVGQSAFFYQVEDLQFDRRFAADREEAAILAALPGELSVGEPLEYPLTTLELDLFDGDIQVLESINQAVIGEAAGDANDYSEQLVRYLRERFAYSLQPDGGSSDGADPVVAWLESGSRGHCELFAGAFVLLARQAGYPARMVVGYAGGSWNAVEDYFVVRNRDAHAWVEIYDRNTESWMRVDPTPGRVSGEAAVGSQLSLPLESGWAAWVDSLRIQWYRRVINFEQDDQVELAMAFKEVALEYTKKLGSIFRDLAQSVKAWVTTPLGAHGIRFWVSPILVLGLAYFLWRLRFFARVLLSRITRRKHVLSPVRREASRHLRRLRRLQVEDPVIEELNAVRFGPKVDAFRAQAVFKNARRIARGGLRPNSQQSSPYLNSKPSEPGIQNQIK